MGLEQYTKSVRETADNLRIIDDALFRLMAEKEGVCQEILRTLLDMPSLNVVKVTAQSVVKSLHREVTLDALCVLENGEYINVEMQKGSGNDDVVRTRFHAAALTSAYIPVYDKEDIFFANTEIKEDSDKSELLQLFLRNKAFDDAKFPEISKAVKYFKETEGGRSEVCKTVENYAKIYAEEAAAESRREGRKEGENILADTVVRLRQGETPEQLAARGIGQSTIDLAMTIK